MGYGEDRIVLMVKDPWWLYAYWEIQPQTERAARAQLLPHEVAGLQSILRVHDVTDVDVPAQPAARSVDISLSGLAMNWYVHTNAPGRSFIVDIGLLAHTGRFVLLARSNRVTTPRYGPSDVIDEAWMTTDEAYWRLVGASVGIGMGASPGGMAHVVLRSLSQQLSSGAWSSQAFAGVLKSRGGLRGFWYRVNAELIIHGATDHKATVSLQGQPIPVRADGTFSVRTALPEGTKTVTMVFTAPDGQQTRTVIPTVSLAWAGDLTTGALPASPLHIVTAGREARVPEGA